MTYRGDKQDNEKNVNAKTRWRGYQPVKIWQLIGSAL